MDAKQNIKPVEVYAGNLIEVGMVKSLLENANITTYFKDEIIGMYNPWWVTPGGAGAIKVIVSSEDYEKARQIVDEYERNNQQSPL